MLYVLLVFNSNNMSWRTRVNKSCNTIKCIISVCPEYGRTAVYQGSSAVAVEGIVSCTGIIGGTIFFDIGGTIKYGTVQ